MSAVFVLKTDPAALPVAGQFYGMMFEITILKFVLVFTCCAGTLISEYQIVSPVNIGWHIICLELLHMLRCNLSKKFGGYECRDYLTLLRHFFVR